LSCWFCCNLFGYETLFYCNKKNKNCNYIELIEKKVASVLATKYIYKEIYFGIYKETELEYNIVNNEKYRAEILQSDIKSCLSCIISFSVLKDKSTEQSPNETESEFIDKVNQNSDFQYFAPIDKLTKKDKIWLILYIDSTLLSAIKSA
jgi:hypothetical protein